MRAFSILLCGLVMFPIGSMGAEEPLPDGKGKDLVESMCQRCHGLDSITQKRRTPEEWQTVIDQMISNGAPLLPKEADIITQYLSEHFAPTTTSSSSQNGSGKTTVPVNTATAEELQSALGLSTKEAAAIVDYREKRGSFKAWEDLQKVPDLDVKKLEPAKDRLTY